MENHQYALCFGQLWYGADELLRLRVNNPKRMLEANGLRVGPVNIVIRRPGQYQPGDYKRDLRFFESADRHAKRHPDP